MFAALPPSINYFYLSIVVVGLIIVLLFLFLYIFRKLNKIISSRPLCIFIKIFLTIIFIIGGLIILSKIMWHYPEGTSESYGPEYIPQNIEQLKKDVIADQYYKGLSISNQSSVAFNIDSTSWAGRFIDYDKPTEEMVKVASERISDKVGKEFFDKYLKYDPTNSMRSTQNGLSTISFIFADPSRGIDYQTTSFPPYFYLELNEDFSINTTYSQDINGLPDCHNLQDCDFLNRDQIMKYVLLDLKKNDIDVSTVRLKMLRFQLNNIPSWPGPAWYFEYDIPQNKVAQCRAGMGANRLVGIDALSKELIKENTVTNCRIKMMPLY